MIICFNISCRECGCDFQINSLKFQPRDKMECPNCGQPFPDHELGQLKQALAGIGSISEMCAESPQRKGFDISIKSAVNEEMPF